MNIQEINKQLKSSTPREIIEWGIKNAKKPVVTTNFRPYEVNILHACVSVKKDIPVIWCDTGYNTSYTYSHGEKLIKDLGINIFLYTPQETAKYRDPSSVIPDVDSPLHKEFTEQVKLEPFRRAMKEHQPDVWFTNLRKGQTALRDSLDIVSKGNDGVLKIAPFYYWTDEELDAYLKKYELENEFRYFDPTKVLENRECGLHIVADPQK